MNSFLSKTILYFITPMIFAVASLAIFSMPAFASFEIVGDREFRDDVNNCFNTYRNTPGIVGDAIRELEDSDNVHRIEESPDWSNASNDLDEATGGSGSGTVTRVEKEALEQYKKDFPELANKDFCTAFLHELYHSLDADRGTRTDHSDRVDGVKRNEVEATIFQNLIHAIRGVPPRTMYGGVDISHIVLAGDGVSVVSVIQYGDKYLPIDQLHKFTGEEEEECDAQEHWHANGGTVEATDGSTVPDPGGCGFGKTASTPVIEVEVRNGG